MTEIEFFTKFELRPAPGSPNGLEVWKRGSGIYGSLFHYRSLDRYMVNKIFDSGARTVGKRKTFASALNLLIRSLENER